MLQLILQLLFIPANCYTQIFPLHYFLHAQLYVETPSLIQKNLILAIILCLTDKTVKINSLFLLNLQSSGDTKNNHPLIRKMISDNDSDSDKCYDKNETWVRDTDFGRCGEYKGVIMGRSQRTSTGRIFVSLFVLDLKPK